MASQLAPSLYLGKYCTRMESCRRLLELSLEPALDLSSLHDGGSYVTLAHPTSSATIEKICSKELARSEQI